MLATGESDENATILLQSLGEGAHDDAELGVVSEDDDTIASVYIKVGGNLNFQVGKDAIILCDISGDVHCSGTISTNTGTTTWELGSYLSGAPSAAGRVEVTINGTTYELLAAIKP